MSWEIALIVSSVVSAGAQVAQGISESQAGVRKAKIARGQALQNADLARLSAITDERRRREEFAIWDNYELANSFYDGPSWMAKREFGSEELETDTELLQLRGRTEQSRWLATAEAKKVEAKAAEQSKWFSIIGAGGTVFKGAYMAEHYKPSENGLLSTWFDD
tara:strand:+ start:2433 stop:2921 length:489 start_codon:yes stop_codon:yes gene_type:complete